MLLAFSLSNSSAAAILVIACYRCDLGQPHSELQLMEIGDHSEYCSDSNMVVCCVANKDISVNCRPSAGLVDSPG